MFDGQFEDALHEAFSRIRFGGGTPVSQKVYYINLQEIKGIKFGTRNPINYFDNFYNAELFLRSHGSYSIKIVDPLKFYCEVVPKNCSHLEIEDINEQYMAEFLEALQTSINQMSADGTRISFVSSKSRELGRYMSNTLDDEWGKMRGIEIQSVGIASISYDEESQKLINLRNQGAMLGDPTIREGYMQGAAARGLEAAGSNAAGAMTGFMGMGAGMQTGAGFMGAASAANMRQMQMNQEQQMYQSQQMNQGQNTRPVAQMDQVQQGSPGAGNWTCSCGNVNAGKFCSECGSPRPVQGNWTCSCGTVNTGKFCAECGRPRS